MPKAATQHAGSLTQPLTAPIPAISAAWGRDPAGEWPARRQRGEQLLVQREAGGLHVAQARSSELGSDAGGFV